jgi:hypothetical protein
MLLGRWELVVVVVMMMYCMMNDDWGGGRMLRATGVYGGVGWFAFMLSANEAQLNARNVLDEQYGRFDRNGFI